MLHMVLHFGAPLLRSVLVLFASLIKQKQKGQQHDSRIPSRTWVAGQTQTWA